MIYLIYSKDKEIINKYIENLKIQENIDNNSIINYTITDDVFELVEECNTLGLFSNRKLIIAESTTLFSTKGKEIVELTNYLNNYNKNVILVFVCYSEKLDTRKKLYKKINEIGTIKSLVKDNNYLINLIKENLDDYTLKDINYFISVVGNDINNLLNELEKLKNYKINEKEITNQDIDYLCEHSFEEEIFSLTDAIVKSDTAKAIKLYKFFLTKSYDVTQMIALIASQFRFLLQVKLLYNQNKTNDEIAKILQVHPYRVKLAIQNNYYYTTDLLCDYLLKLFELDKRIKLGSIDKNTFFELFILNKNI